MFWKWFWKGLAGLLILALFVGGGIAIYRIGFTHGVTAGLWDAAEGSQVLPPDGLHFSPYARPRVFFPGLGLFLGFILIVFIFGGIGRMIRYSCWRQAGQPYPPHWGPGWHNVHHHPFTGQAPRPGDPPTDPDSGDE